jgi:hypothetical protein
MPLIILDLDGVIGYWDENKNYHIQASTISYLIALSHNYRLVAICST